MGNINSEQKENLPDDGDKKRKSGTGFNTVQLLANNHKEKNRFLNDSRYVQLPFYDSTRWTTIYHNLSELHKTIETSQGFSMILIEKTIMSYNPEYINDWNFALLFELVERFDPNDINVKEFMLNLVNLALDLPSLMSGQPIPVLIRGVSKHVSLSQMQCASILANAFFCTFPVCENRNLNSINLNKLFCTSRYDEHRKSRKIEKLKCLINYFKRIFEKKSKTLEQTNNLIFIRKVFTHDGDDLLKESNKPIIAPIISNDKKIEDFPKVIEVDFANKHIGGGVLGTGCVQEEIRFVLSPELIVSLLFCETLDDKETILIKGAERFNDYEGYSDTFKWKSNHNDHSEYDETGRLETYIVAMDAIEFKDRIDQFQSRCIIRDVNKCFSGFNSFGEELNGINTKGLSVASGHWGCGAFNGDKEIKFLIQLLVSSALDKRLIYCTFDDGESVELFQNITRIILEKNLRINKIYAHLFEYCAFKLNSRSFSKSVNFCDFLKGKK